VDVSGAAVVARPALPNDKPAKGWKPVSDELLYAPLSKLKRAEHHINDLNQQANAFLAERPFKLMVRMGGDTGKIVLWVKKENPIPPELSLIIGDAAHNLRAALDLTLFPMAKDRTTRPNRIQFPFATDDSDTAFKDACKGGQVEFAGKKVVEEIRLLQPYPTGNRKLHGIHELDIRDKHRLLILAPFIPTIITGTKYWDYIKPFLGNIEFPEGIPFRFTRPDNDSLLAVNLTGDAPYTEGQAPVQPPFVLSFGEGQPFADRPVIQVLNEAHQEVRRAVEAMAAAFAHPSNTCPP
jgi:hypothetical protein